MALNTSNFNDIMTLLNTQEFSGTLLYAKSGNIEFSTSLSHYNEKLTINTDTIFNIGSITKQFTAMAILILQEQGKLNLDDFISNFIPDYEHSSKITIKNLLSHTAGIPNYTAIFEEYELKNINTPTKLLDMFFSHDLEFKPGTEFQYSNSGYAVLGYIIELLTGLSYGKFIQKYIFVPLGMTRSGEIHSCFNSNKATGYTLEGDPIDILNKYIPYAAGGLYSTANDLLLWDQSLYRNQLISEKTMKLMFTPIVENYSLGWQVSQKSDFPVFFHGGGIQGFTSLYVRKPSEKVSIICLSNISGYDIDPLIVDFEKLISKKYS